MQVEQCYAFAEVNPKLSQAPRIHLNWKNGDSENIAHRRPAAMGPPLVLVIRKALCRLEKVRHSRLVEQPEQARLSHVSHTMGFRLTAVISDPTSIVNNHGNIPSLSGKVDRARLASAEP